MHAIFFIAWMYKIVISLCRVLLGQNMYKPNRTGYWSTSLAFQFVISCDDLYHFILCYLNHTDTFIYIEAARDENMILIICVRMYIYW